ncbi:MAG: macro domain-containing protein [Acidobacteriota bacterium]
MKISVVKGDITEMEVDAIVNPANSYGWMGGGVAGAIKRKGGKEIEDEAIRKGPTPIGKAILTRAGALPCRHVIHAPTMEQPAGLTNLEKIRKATEAALICADQNELKTLAIPGMGTGVGMVPPEDAALVMLDVIRKHNAKILSEVILVAFDDVLLKAFKMPG